MVINSSPLTPLPLGDIQLNRSIQLSYQLLSVENFLIKAIEYRVASESPDFDPKNNLVFKNLNNTTRNAIRKLADALPQLLNPNAFSPPTTWNEIYKQFQNPMHTLLEQIKSSEDQIILLSGIKQPNGVQGEQFAKNLHIKILEREAKLSELRAKVIIKNEQRKKILTQLQQNIQNNPKAGTHLDNILMHIRRSTKRADRYRRWQHPLSILSGSLNAMARGPYLPFGVMGQICAPIPALASQYCRLQSIRCNPNTSPPDYRDRILRSTWVTAGIGVVGIFAAASVGLLNAFAITAATPFLLPIAATAALVGNISGTLTALTNRKNAKKRPSESIAGKKIRMKGHFADVLLNLSNVVASSGLLGITLATVGVLSLAFPPATLALIGTVALGITIGATIVSAGVYLRKTACWEKANNLKLFSDFQHACRQGLVDALSPGIQAKQMRNIAKPNFSSRFFGLFNRDKPLVPPKPEITLRCTTGVPEPKETSRHFEHILDMGFIPRLIDIEDKPTILPKLNVEPSKIRLTHLVPPDPLLAMRAIFEQGGIPEIHDKKLKEKIFKAYNNSQPKKNKLYTFEQVYKVLCNRYAPQPLRPAYTNAYIDEVTETISTLSSLPSINYLYKAGHSLGAFLPITSPTITPKSTPRSGPTPYDFL